MNDVRGGLAAFLEALGLGEEPMGMYYTDMKPEAGYTPDKCILPTLEEEANGQGNWEAVMQTWSCIIGKLWLARKKKTTAWFEEHRFGCPGGIFYLGYMEQPLEMVLNYISTGFGSMLPGEHYLESPEAARRFFAAAAPPPAPKPYCVFKPVTQFTEDEPPELVVFFCRPEVIAGLCQLAYFITNDIDVVVSPFGAACSGILSWPRIYLAQNKFKAVLGGWDATARKFFKTDEVSFTIPYAMYKMMLNSWPDSFISQKIWKGVKKKIKQSSKAWGEEPKIIKNRPKDSQDE